MDMNNPTLVPDGHLSDQRAIVNNPFFATTQIERDENFPSFSQALLSFHTNSSGGATTVSGGDASHAVNLSISALAALSEHNRHVARYGIDNSLADDDDNDHFPSFTDPLDVEWERLLLNTTANTANLSHISSNHSTQATAEYPIKTDQQVVVTTSNSPDGAGVEAIEVLTEVSCSDFLNTSRSIHALRTPDHARNSESVTIRGREAHLSSTHNDSSEATFSDDSTHVLQKMYLDSMLPPIQQGFDKQYSSSRGSPYHTRSDNQPSFSLNSVDISRISADDDDESIVAKISDVAATASDSIILDPMNTYFTGNSLMNDQTPYMSNSRNRKEFKKHRQQPLTEIPVSTPDYDLLWRDSPRTRGPGQNTNPRANFDYDSAESATSRNQFCYNSPNRRQPAYSSVQRRWDVLDKTNANTDAESVDDDTIESKLAMMGLSPISKQAADKAISILHSLPDWNVALSPHRNRNYPESASSFPNPFTVGQLPSIRHGDSFGAPSNSDTSSGNDNTRNDELLVRVSKRHTSNDQPNDDSKDSIIDHTAHHTYDDNGNDISPLHSSSEDKIESDSSKKSTRVNPDVIESSCSSDDRLKKNSLSSISPNSSSEHHVTTKPTANSSSSLSVSSKLSIIQRESECQETLSKSLSPSNPVVKSYSQQTWDDFTDRRRYRTVVPIRVFIGEPNNFPDEDDSFSKHPKQQLSLSLPLHIGTSSREIGYDQYRPERSIRSTTK
jgi:hypothetical protein